MISAVILSLLSVALATDFPQPNFTYTGLGGADISLDNTVHNNVVYGGKDEIEYAMKGEIDEDAGLALTPPRRITRGTVVFREDFNGAAFDASKWDYEVSMYGGYNGEFQAYVPDHRNVFVKNGHLYIKPTFTTDDDRFTAESIHNGAMDMKALYGYCTNSDRYGCYRQGQHGCLPPVMSGKLKSKTTIRFGKVEVRARIPRGDWLWPAIWMLPKNSEYGGWPASGEIDLMESRGNSFAGYDANNHGSNEVGATLHWGPDAGNNRFQRTHGDLDGDWAYAMHTYRLEWTVDHIQVFVDDRLMMNVGVPSQSFWNWGQFSGNNIWSSGTKAAPFDKAFYLILNVAVGGTSGFFQDNWHYNSQKPWQNNSPNVLCDFWDARGIWMSTWHGNDVALEALDGNNVNHGVDEVGATMHWGPDAGQNRFSLTHGDIHGDWSHDLHTYRLDWNVNHIHVSVDNRPMMDIPITQSFWQKGGFGGSNIWGSGTKAAPFDQQFYLILNVAIGGTSGFFPDGWRYNSPKPWNNNSPHENADFWNARHNWQPSWQGDAVAMEIDYVDMKQC